MVVIDFPHSIFFLQVSLSLFHTHGWEFRRVVVAIGGVQQDGAGVPQVETYSGHLNDVFPRHLRRFGHFADGDTKLIGPTRFELPRGRVLPDKIDLTSGQVLCAARNSTGGLAWSVYNGASWSKFANLTTSAVSAPSCTADNTGGVIYAVFTTGDATQVTRFAGSAWEGFLNLAGMAASEPNCTSMNSGGQVVCFAEAYFSGIYATRFNGGSWTVADWSTYGNGNLGGEVTNNANCTTQAAGQLCGVISIENAFYADVYNGTSWSIWNKIGGTGVGIPSCAPLGTGQVVCVIIGVNNKLTSVVGP